MPGFAATERVALAEAQSWSERVMAFVERGHAFACALLVLLSLACFLPGFVSLQPMDRDEPRFAQASKQMLETGDFVDIRFQDEARHKKPVGIYWMQSATVAAGEALGIPEARTTIALYRLPSLMGAIATVLLTYWAALAFVGRRGAFLAGAFMAASVILMVEARLAKTDAVLAATCVAAMGALARAYLARGSGVLPRRTVLGFWAAVALGVLIKGPMILLFTGLPAAVLSWRERSGAWLLALRPSQGIPLALLIVLPWFLAIAWRSGGDFFAASVGEDMLAKVGSGQEKHGAPPGFYLLAYFATFWPAAVLGAASLIDGWRHRRDDKVAFLLAWIIPAWLVFEVVPTKLPHYVMPLYPALAILTVLAMLRGVLTPRHLGTGYSTGLIPLIPFALMVGLAAAAWILDRDLMLSALPLLALSGIIGLAAWFFYRRDRVLEAALAAILAAPILALSVFGFAQHDLQALKISPRLAEAARALPCRDPVLASLGYREPSLVFLTKTNLEMLASGEQAAAFLQRGGCRAVFVEERFEEAFRLEAERLRLTPRLTARVKGFNINSGRRVDLGVYAAP